MMNNDYLLVDSIGYLKYEYTIVLLDYPRVFTCSLKDNHAIKYLFYEYKVSSDSYSWLAISVTYNELELLNSSKIHIADIFYKKKRKLIITSNKGQEVCAAKYINKVPENVFSPKAPYTGGFIPYGIDEHRAQAEKDLIDSEKPLVSIVASIERRFKPILSLASFKKISEKFYAFCKNVINGLPEDNVLFYFSEGSTVINFQINEPINFQPGVEKTDKTAAEIIVETTDSLLHANTKDDAQKASNYNTAVLTSFNDLLSSSKTELGNIQIICSSNPEKPNISVTNIDEKRANELGMIFSQINDNEENERLGEPFKVTGTLKGILKLQNKTFQFTDENERTYCGRVDKNVFEQLHSFDVDGKKYEATIAEILSTKKIKYKYVLLSIGPDKNIKLVD